MSFNGGPINGEGNAVGIDKFFKMAAGVVKRAGKMALGRSGRSTSKKRPPGRGK